MAHFGGRRQGHKQNNNVNKQNNSHPFGPFAIYAYAVVAVFPGRTMLGLKRPYPFSVSSEPLRKTHVSEKENLARDPSALHNIHLDTVKMLFAGANHAPTHAPVVTHPQHQSPAPAVLSAPLNSPEVTRRRNSYTAGERRRVTFAEVHNRHHPAVSPVKQATLDRYLGLGQSAGTPAVVTFPVSTPAVGGSRFVLAQTPWPTASSCVSCLRASPAAPDLVRSIRCSLCSGSVCASCRCRCERCGKEACGNCVFQGDPAEGVSVCWDCNSMME